SLTLAHCETTSTSALCAPVDVLAEGERQLGASLTDEVGNVTSAVPITITVDTTAPEITIISPVNDAVVSVAAVEIVGNISEAANVFIDGEPMVVSQEGRFSTTRELLEGINEFHIVAEDRAGNSGTFDLRVHRDTSAPA